ncbi:MAG: 6,7-dimethyl-8-ribityllumazine synthase [Halobacteriales archaeon]
MVALGLVVSRFNRPITERMEETALQAAEEADATVVETVHVPGTYDAPLSADRLARRSDVEAVAVLGAIIEGDTDHDEVIGHAVAESLAEVSLDRDTPVTFGVTGPGMTAEEARDRVDKGREAVESAIDIVEAHR